MTDILKSKVLSLCACLGPAPGDEHCPCHLESLGLQSNNPDYFKWTPEKIEELENVLSEYEPESVILVEQLNKE